jgi:hypothetical protein
MQYAPSRRSMAAPDAHFLLGEAKWFGSGPLPPRLPHEINAPDAWNGWRRQRLQPSLTGFLFPAAWSVFLLAAGLIPMLLHAIGHGIGMDLRLGLSLWLGSFFLLWLSASLISLNQTEGSPTKMWLWNTVRIETILLGVLVWVVYSEPVGSLAVVAMLISLPLWMSHMVRIATLLAWPSGRWLLPIAHVDIGLSSIDAEWTSESKRWARRPLARREISSGEMGDTRLAMVLFGVREGNQDFIAMHLVHPSGVIIDPFVGPSIGHSIPFPGLGPTFADVPNVVAIQEQIGHPPVTPVVAQWPTHLVPEWDSEEE